MPPRFLHSALNFASVGPAGPEDVQNSAGPKTPNSRSFHTKRETPMKQSSASNRTTIRATRFSVVLALAAFAFLFSASNAKAGCAFTTKTADAPPPFPAFPLRPTHPQNPRTTTTIAASTTPSWACGMSCTTPTTPPRRSRLHRSNSTSPTKCGTTTAPNGENAFLPPSGNNVCYGVLEGSR